MKINKAQASLEFTLVFVITLLFIVLTVNVFIWLNHCMVGRQVGYEDTRSEAGTPEDTLVGKTDFYTRPDLNVFAPGGYLEK